MKEEEKVEVCRNEKTGELIYLSKEVLEIVDKALDDCVYGISYKAHPYLRTGMAKMKYFGSAATLSSKKIKIWTVSGRGGGKSVSVDTPYYFFATIFKDVSIKHLTDEESIKRYIDEYIKENFMWFECCFQSHQFQVLNDLLMEIDYYYKLASDHCNIEFIDTSNRDVPSIIISSHELDDLAKPEALALLRTLIYYNQNNGKLNLEEQNINNLHPAQMIKLVVNYMNNLHLNES